MKIGSVLENQKIEKRISITPDIVKKYTSLGFEILLSENYGHHIGINNDEYKKLGVKFSEAWWTKKMDRQWEYFLLKIQSQPEVWLTILNDLTIF